jgi:hypothetical protein
MTIDYKKVYSDLSGRLSELKDQRAILEANLGDIVKEIERLTASIGFLSPLAGYAFWPENIVGLGITDAVRSVLDPNDRLSVAEIKDRMAKRGFDFSSYSAPNASIHTILKRLVEAEKAAVEKEGWKTYYKLVMNDEDIPF